MTNPPGAMRDSPVSAGALEQAVRYNNDILPTPEPRQTAPGKLPAQDGGATIAPVRDWTVIYYSTTKDILSYSLISALLEMKKTGTTDRVNVVVEAALPVRSPSGTLSVPSIRMVLGKAADPEKIAGYSRLLRRYTEGVIDSAVLKAFSGDIVKTENNADTGDWRRAAEFINWARENYPAKRYALVLFGHGEGFLDRKKFLNNGKGVLIDAVTHNYVTLPELRLLMAATGKVDLFAMHSCVMQMAEVAYQLRDYADVIVGSSDLQFGTGYDMRGFLDALNAAPGASSKALGADLAAGYVRRIHDRASPRVPGAQASALSSSKLQGFTARLDAWVDAVMALKDKRVFRTAIHEVVRFDIFAITPKTANAAAARAYSISGDLYDFVRLINENLPQDDPVSPLARGRGIELMDFIAGELVAGYSYTGNSTTGFGLGRAHGLAIHVPPELFYEDSLEGFNSISETNYWDLPFAKETRWGTFLNWLYAAK